MVHLGQQRCNVNYFVLSMFGIDISIRFNYRRRHYFYSEGSVSSYTFVPEVLDMTKNFSCFSRSLVSSPD